MRRKRGREAWLPIGARSPLSDQQRASSCRPCFASAASPCSALWGDRSHAFDRRGDLLFRRQSGWLKHLANRHGWLRDRSAWARNHGDFWCKGSAGRAGASCLLIAAKIKGNRGYYLRCPQIRRLKKSRLVQRSPAGSQRHQSQPARVGPPHWDRRLSSRPAAGSLPRRRRLARSGCTRPAVSRLVSWAVFWLQRRKSRAGDIEPPAREAG